MFLKKKDAIIKNDINSYIDLEIKSLKLKNFKHCHSLLPLHLTSWVLEDLLKYFNKIYYISFSNKTELEEKLRKFYFQITKTKFYTKLRYIKPAKMHRKKSSILNKNFKKKNFLDLIFRRDELRTFEILKNKKIFKI